MLKVADYALLPVLLANITIAANLWELWGAGIGQVLFWVAIALAWVAASGGRYAGVATVAVAAALVLRLGEQVTGGQLIEVLRHVAVAGVLIIAGATVAARRPHLIRRQLVVYLAVSIPLMLLQMSGVSSVVMGWNTEYAHSEDVLLIEEIGTFKKIPVYPSLFVPREELFYQIGQGRPVGLSYSNNVLSVLVAIAVGLSVGMARSSRLTIGGAVVATALVLTMSLTALAAALLTYAVVFLAGPSWRRLLVWKTVLLIGALQGIYYLFFPGLFTTNFSDAKLLQSVFTRGLELFDMVGLDWLRRAYDERIYFLGDFVKTDSTYSGVAKILSSPLGGGLAIAAPFGLWFYLHRLRLMKRSEVALYFGCGVTAVACVLSQFGVPYFEAPLFQFIFGFALLPLFRGLWPIGDQQQPSMTVLTRVSEPGDSGVTPGTAPRQGTASLRSR